MGKFEDELITREEERLGTVFLKEKLKNQPKIERLCLGEYCKKKFTTKNKFIRLCESCRKQGIYSCGL